MVTGTDHTDHTSTSEAPLSTVIAIRSRPRACCDYSGDGETYGWLRSRGGSIIQYIEPNTHWEMNSHGYMILCILLVVGYIFDCLSTGSHFAKLTCERFSVCHMTSRPKTVDIRKPRRVMWRHDQRPWVVGNHVSYTLPPSIKRIWSSSKLFFTITAPIKTTCPILSPYA